MGETWGTHTLLVPWEMGLRTEHRASYWWLLFKLKHDFERGPLWGNVVFQKAIKVHVTGHASVCIFTGAHLCA